MINLDNCRYVVWGFKNPQNYHTHSHIHEAFYRVLKLTGKDVQWLDHMSAEMSILTPRNFSNTLFISEHAAAKQGMPILDDCFYVIHGLNNDPEMSAKMSGIKNRLSWNVYHDYSHGNPEEWERVGRPQITDVRQYGRFLRNVSPDSTKNYDRIFLAEDAPYYPKEKHMDFRWATDLVPSEIAKLTPVKFPGPTKKIHWIGTHWFVNQKELHAFDNACNENGIEFTHFGAGQNGVVTIEENIRLVRESYFAPAISGSHHLTEGYVPCRIFKNISYGQMGITNSKRVNDIFGGRLIFNPDAHALFYDAVAQLPLIPVERIQELMDYVSKNHTYLNRLDSILKAARLVLEDR